MPSNARGNINHNLSAVKGVIFYQGFRFLLPPLFFTYVLFPTHPPLRGSASHQLSIFGGKRDIAPTPSLLSVLFLPTHPPSEVSPLKLWVTPTPGGINLTECFESYSFYLGRGERKS
jgi:hypothetical protein